MCFNSSLVRLKEQPTTLILLQVPSFNSSLVRLKVIFFKYRIFGYQSFNSSLVRLKVRSDRGYPDLVL